MANHLLYLTNNQLIATIWDKGIFVNSQTFDNYASGWLRFSDYLKDYYDVPTFLLTDLIEEDFQREAIPHVFGSARKNLIQRRLNTLYRDTPFSTASGQGREKSGRRDDQILFSALTNAQLLQPWLDALQNANIDLTGIYSVALLNSLFYSKLNLGSSPALIVTHQSCGLRQSYFHDGYLRFSRLVPETAWSPESIAEMTDSEMAKTRQFLASTRLLARGADLNVVVIANNDVITQLKMRCKNEDGMQYRFINISDAQSLFGAKGLAGMTVCDSLFLSLLVRRRIPSHYATSEQARVFYFSQVKIALNTLSALSVAIATIWSANNVFDAYHAYQVEQEAKMYASSTLERYQSAVRSKPMTVATAQDMKFAVETENLIVKNAPTPTKMLEEVSRALDVAKYVKLTSLSWETSEVDVEAAAAAAMVAPPVPNGENVPIPSGQLGVSNKPFEILNLECDIAPFKNDYRTALESAEQFVLALQKNPHVQVIMTKPPLDTRPSVSLESLSGDDEALAKPKFSIKIVWRP